jgi:hypothetical protein
MDERNYRFKSKKDLDYHIQQLESILSIPQIIIQRKQAYKSVLLFIKKEVQFIFSNS